MKNRCGGLTLVELMISLVLGLMVMGGAVSIFLSSKETFKLEEDLARLQEDFRYIAYRLTKDLSLVGYTGCALPYQTDKSPTVTSRLSGASGDRDVVTGSDGGTTSSPDSLTFSYAKPGTGTKVIIGEGLRPDSPVHISTNTVIYKALQDNLAMDAESRAPLPLMIGNCDGSDIFVVTGIDEHDETGATSPAVGEAALRHEKNIMVGGLSNAEDVFNVAYGDHTLSEARIYFTEDVTYEICAGGRGLCVTRGGGEPEMLIPDVTDFQVKYGVDSASTGDGNADHYVDWSSGIISSDITSIKVTLTMVLNQVAGNDVTKTYSFTVKLRNMGLKLI